MSESENAIGNGRRLARWSIAEKCRIVEETFAPGASVAQVSRRHNVNANQVFAWRKKYRQGALTDRKAVAKAALPSPDLVRIGVVDGDGGLCPVPVAPVHCGVPFPEPLKMLAAPVVSRAASGMIEIELSGGIKLRVDSDVDESHLRRVLAVVMA